VTGDDVDFRTAGEAVRVALGEAARHREEGRRVLAPKPPDLPEGVAVRAGGHGAGVEDDDLRRFAGGRRLESLGLERSGDGVGFDLAHLAAENMYGVGSSGAPADALGNGKLR
jgi:hypothetical protein